MEITNKHIEFFKETLGVDVSQVKVLFTSDETMFGFYSHGMPGFIHLNRGELSKVHKGNTSLTIIHELTHLVQYEHKKSLFLNFNTGIEPLTVRKHSEHLRWEDKPMEIDAVLTEAYFLYSLVKEKEMTSIVTRLIKDRLKDSIYLYKIIDGLTKSTLDKEFVNILVNEFGQAEKEVAVSKA